MKITLLLILSGWIIFKRKRRILYCPIGLDGRLISECLDATLFQKRTNPLTLNGVIGDYRGAPIITVFTEWRYKTSAEKNKGIRSEPAQGKGISGCLGPYKPIRGPL